MGSLALGAKVLSVPPVFDLRLASILLREARLEPYASKETGEAFVAHTVRELYRAGLVTPFTSWWRFADPVRTDMLGSLQSEDAALYARLAAKVVHAMSNGSGDLMRKALGERGAAITAAVLGVAVAQREDSSAFKELVNELGTSSQQGRAGDALSVVRLLATIPRTPDRERQMRFLAGLSAWQVGNKAEAIPHFVVVWKAGIEDQAYGIASHLLAAWEQARRRPELAYPYAIDAVKALRRIGDQRGVALALTTLGRVERDLIDINSPLATNADAIKTLESAVTTARAISPRQAAVALGFLAGALQHARRWDEALEVAEEAESLFPPDDVELLHVLTMLGSLYRSVGRHEDGRRALLKGVEIAESVEDDMQVAILANVLAGNERYAKRLDDAVKHARLSVALGEKLGNIRHLSQAYNTLARVLADAASTATDIEEALSAAEKSKALLKELGDTRGQVFIERTIQEIVKKRDRM